MRNGIEEFRILGEVDPAVEHVRGEPRNPQTLHSGGVELCQLGNRRYLAQQPPAIEPALRQGGLDPRQLRGPAELRLDILDELLDLGRRRFRLLALDSDQRRFVLLVEEPDFECGVGEQGDADDGNEQPHIFREQTGTDLERRESRTTRTVVAPIAIAKVAQRMRTMVPDGSFQGLGGGDQQRRRNLEVELLRSLEVEDQIELRRILDRHLGRARAFEHAAGIFADLAVGIE